MIYLCFLVIIGILLFFIMKLLHDLHCINQQAHIKLETNSSFTITSDLKLKELNELCCHVNLLYEKYQLAQQGEWHKETEFKEMLANIAHDVRTPLTSVQGYLQILQEDAMSAEHEAYFHIIDQRILDIRNLLEQFFTYAKLINHENKDEEATCNLYDTCCESLAGFYQQFQERAMEPDIQFEDKKQILPGSKQQWMRVVDNLLQNALLHGDGNIKIKQAEHQLIFSNNLKATSQIDMDKVFDRFYKADVSRSTISSGLGLPIVKQMLRLLGGSVTASIENEQFIIFISLPLQE